MGNIRRFYYKNKSKILKIAIFVIFILLIIQVINYLVKTTDKKEKYNNNVEYEEDNIVSNVSSLTGNEVDSEKLEKDSNVMKKFLDLCNEKNFEEAYNLLTDECKEVMFKTYDIFKRTYCDEIFAERKNYKIENWIGNTYKVRIYEDPLATGKVSNDMAIQEYFTIVGNKLNINNYIGRENINKSATQNNITINVIYRDVFKEYEEYKIEVVNNTNNTIMLDDGNESQTIYIEDSNKIKYEVATSEIIYSNLKINPGVTRIYEMKFLSTYSSSKEIEQMVFEKVITNYNEYIKDSNNYSDCAKIIIGL